MTAQAAESGLSEQSPLPRREFVRAAPAAMTLMPVSGTFTRITLQRPVAVTYNADPDTVPLKTQEYEVRIPGLRMDSGIGKSGFCR